MSHKFTSLLHDISFLMMVNFICFNPISAVKEAFLCGELGTSDPERSTLFQLINVSESVGLDKYELLFVNRTKTLIYSPKRKLLLFNIISPVFDTFAPAVRKLADATQDEVFWLPV